MGVFTQLASNMKGFACKFACRSAYASCVNWALPLAQQNSYKTSLGESSLGSNFWLDVLGPSDPLLVRSLHDSHFILLRSYLRIFPQSTLVSALILQSGTLRQILCSATWFSRCCRSQCMNLSRDLTQTESFGAAILVLDCARDKAVLWA